MTFRINKGILYIDLSGRIDAANAPAAETEIRKIREENPGMPTVLDADTLTYISSAGLRVIMRILREEPKLAIINAAPEVYQIFEMTGFTDMMKIEKAYPRISVDGCEFIAKGSNGAVYRYDPETVVKVYYNPDALPEIEQERKNARTAFVLGVNTALPYGIVRIGDGYGTLTEMLNATSLTKLLRGDSASMEQVVDYYIDTIKHVHGITVEPGLLPEMKAQMLGWVDFLQDHLPADQYEKLRHLVQILPNSRNLLHGDYHTNNILLQNGETILIDMDTIATGHPIFELAFMYNSYVGMAQVDPQESMAFYGFPFETSQRFWQLSLQKYLGTQEEAIVRSVENKAKVIGYARMLRRAIRRVSPTSPTRIAECRRQLACLLPEVDTLEF